MTFPTRHLILVSATTCLLGCDGGATETDDDTDTDVPAPDCAALSEGGSRSEPIRGARSGIDLASDGSRVWLATRASPDEAAQVRVYDCALEEPLDRQIVPSDWAAVNPVVVTPGDALWVALRRFREPRDPDSLAEVSLVPTEDDGTTLSLARADVLQVGHGVSVGIATVPWHEGTVLAATHSDEEAFVLRTMEAPGRWGEVLARVPSGSESFSERAGPLTRVGSNARLTWTTREPFATHSVQITPEGEVLGPETWPVLRGHHGTPRGEVHVTQSGAFDVTLTSSEGPTWTTRGQLRGLVPLLKVHGERIALSMRTTADHDGPTIVILDLDLRELRRITFDDDVAAIDDMTFVDASRLAVATRLARPPGEPNLQLHVVAL